MRRRRLAQPAESRSEAGGPQLKRGHVEFADAFLPLRVTAASFVTRLTLRNAFMATVSVILPTYNRLAYLSEAIRSVLAQSYTDWELIVADDGSTDGTRAYLETITDPRVRSVLLSHSGNLSFVRNAAAATARGEWIALLDSDDLWLPDKLKVQLEQLAMHPIRRWSSTGISLIDADGAPLPKKEAAPHHPPSGWILEALLRFEAGATTPSLLMQRSLFDAIGRFDESLLLREDYDLHLRLAARSEIHALPDVLTLVREHSGRTSNNQSVAELHSATADVFRKAAMAATSAHVRAICRRQRALQFIYRARVLSRDHEHSAALASVLAGAANAPFALEVWRAAVGTVLRSVGWKRSS